MATLARAYYAQQIFTMQAALPGCGTGLPAAQLTPAVGVPLVITENLAQDAASYAIVVGTAPWPCTLDLVDFINYSAATGQNDSTSPRLKLFKVAAADANWLTTDFSGGTAAGATIANATALLSGSGVQLGGGGTGGNPQANQQLALGATTEATNRFAAGDRLVAVVAGLNGDAGVNSGVEEWLGGYVQAVFRGNEL